MNRSVAAGTAAAVAALTLLPGAPATAASDGSLQGLVLSGGCTGPSELKNVVVAPRTPFLFAPLRFYGPEFTPMKKWLLPVTVTVTGEGLKARHLTPGVTYALPVRPPRNQITCTFEGRTKEEGDFLVTMTGLVLGP